MDRLSKGLEIEGCANGMGDGVGEWAGERIHDECLGGDEMDGCLDGQMSA